MTDSPIRLRDLKGARLSTICALLIAGVPMPQYAIEEATGYGRDAVRSALRWCQRRHVADVSHKRSTPTHGVEVYWTLLRGARSLPLPLHWLPGEASAILSQSEEDEERLKSMSLVNPPPPQDPTAILSQLSHAPLTAPQIAPEYAEIVDLLRAYGVPLARVYAIIARADAAQQAPDDLRARIERAAAHAQSTQNTRHKIRHVGFFIAACLEDGRAIPDPLPADVSSGDHDHLDPSTYAGYQAEIDEGE